MLSRHSKKRNKIHHDALTRQEDSVQDANDEQASNCSKCSRSEQKDKKV